MQVECVHVQILKWCANNKYLDKKDRGFYFELNVPDGAVDLSFFLTRRLILWGCFGIDFSFIISNFSYAIDT